MVTHTYSDFILCLLLQGLSMKPCRKVFDVVRAIVVCASCEQVVAFLQLLQRRNSSSMVLPQAAVAQSLLEPSLVNEHTETEIQDTFSIDIVQLNSSSLLTPGDGDWMELVVNLRIDLQGASMLPASSLICEIRILHARSVPTLEPTIE